ncbi:MAG: hypothetical protein IJX20_02350 [Alphaproteobacteria bacterium]|nr:hypothetical protein [Alphaproteobacteria bacterium]
MDYIIIILVSVIIVLHAIQFIYHSCFRVVYLPTISKLILLGNIASVIFTACVLYQQQDFELTNYVFLILFLSILTIVNAFILHRNWKKYTVSSFVQNGIYEFEVQGFNHGFVFGRIYWNRKKYPNVYCTGWLYTNYIGCSFAEMCAEYRKNTQMLVGDLYRVSFVEKACFPYCSVEPNRGNVVKRVS